MLCPGWIFDKHHTVVEVSESEFGKLSYRVVNDKNPGVPFVVTAEEHRKNLKMYFDHVAKLATNL